MQGERKWQVVRGGGGWKLGMMLWQVPEADNETTELMAPEWEHLDAVWKPQKHAPGLLAVDATGLNRIKHDLGSIRELDVGENKQVAIFR